MHPVTIVLGVSLLFLIGQLFCLEAGYRFGSRKIKQEGEKAHAGIGATEAAIFSLLGLILAFTFSGAQTRFDHRIHVMVEEANAIGTAYRRLDLLPPAEQPTVRDLMRKYVDSRIISLADLTDNDVAAGHLAHSAKLQNEIWQYAQNGCRGYVQQPCSMLLLPAVNQMFDMSATHTVALRTHLPGVVLVLLICLALISAVLAGYAMSTRGRRSFIQMLFFSATISLTVYTVLDLEYPRVWLIRIGSADHVMHELRDSMK